MTDCWPCLPRAEENSTPSSEPAVQAATPRTRRPLPAKTLTSKLSKTNSRTMPARDAPIAIRNAISRRRPLKRTSKRLATLLHAISNTKHTAANSVAKPARIFSVTSCGSVLTMSSAHCRSCLGNARDSFDRAMAARLALVLPSFPASFGRSRAESSCRASSRSYENPGS